MGKHNVSNGRWPHRPRQTAGAGMAVDPEDRGLVEPDRDLAAQLSQEERAAREGVHTDRDPQDDIHLAATDPGDRSADSAGRAEDKRTVSGGPAGRDEV